jgi:hypothetical protein
MDREQTGRAFVELAIVMIIATIGLYIGTKIAEVIR